MNNTKEYKIRALFALAAFLFLGASLGLTFKNNSVLSDSYASKLFAATGKSSDSADYFITQKAPDGGLSVIPINTQDASKETGFSPEQIKDLASKISSGMIGGCISNIGSVTVSHSVCAPPGVGKCMGQKGSGKDMCPCPVSGTQGGSVTAICWQGCCRAVSASSPSQALQGLGQGQQSLLGILGQGLGQFLGQMMQGGGSDGGGYYPNYDYTPPPSVTDDFSGTSSVVDTNETSYLNPDTNTNFDFGDSYTETSVVDTNNKTESVDTARNNEDTIETLILKDDEKEERAQAASPRPATPAPQTKPVATQRVPEQNEIEQINRSEIYNYEFQALDKEKSNDSRLAELRDPDKSSVAKLKFKQDQDLEPEFITEKEASKSWWQRFIDWLLGL